MEVLRIFRSCCLFLMLFYAASCGSQTTSYVANPIADESRAQAHQLSLQSRACRTDAATYLANHTDLRSCTSGIVEIGLTNNRPVNNCVETIMAAVPTCKQWDENYRSLIGDDDRGDARTDWKIVLIEQREMAPAQSVIDSSSGAAFPSGD